MRNIDKVKEILNDVKKDFEGYEAVIERLDDYLKKLDEEQSLINVKAHHNHDPRVVSMIYALAAAIVKDSRYVNDAIPIVSQSFQNTALDVIDMVMDTKNNKTCMLCIMAQMEQEIETILLPMCYIMLGICMHKLVPAGDLETLFKKINNN